VKISVVSELDSLEALRPSWDALVESGPWPRSSPALILAWYRCALPPGAKIWVFVAHEAETLVGLCPFYVQRTRYGLIRYSLAAPQLYGVEPLAAAGKEDEIGEELGAAMAEARAIPDVICLDWSLVGSRIATCIRRAWTPRRLALVRSPAFPNFRVVHHGADFEGWLRERSPKFRHGFRSDYRKLLAAGVTYRRAVTREEILERLEPLALLYEGRRAVRGGAGYAFDDTMKAVFTEAVMNSDPGRIRLSTLERSGATVAVSVVLSAGSESVGWLAAFDKAWARYGPMRVAMVLGVGESIERGDTVFDLGSGGAHYKIHMTKEMRQRNHVVLSRRGLYPFHSPVQIVSYTTRQALLRSLGRLRGQ